MGGTTCFRCQEQISPFRRLVSRLCRECDRCDQCGAPLSRDARRLAMAGLTHERAHLCQQRTHCTATRKQIVGLARRRDSLGRDDYPFLCRSCRDKWLLEKSGANREWGYSWDKTQLFRWEPILLSEMDIGAFLRALEVTPLHEVPPHKPRVVKCLDYGFQSGPQRYGTQHVGGEHHTFTEREVLRDLWALLGMRYGRSLGAMTARFIAESTRRIDHTGMTACTPNLINCSFCLNDQGLRLSLRADVSVGQGVFEGALEVFRTGERQYLLIYDRPERTVDFDK